MGKCKALAQKAQIKQTTKNNVRSFEERITNKQFQDFVK